MDARPVGFFDSGLGGLTAVSAFRSILPDENIIYFGDTGRCPYGTRPAAQLRGMARQNLDYLASFNCKAIIAACGTMSASAADILNSFSIPVFNVLSPSVSALANVPGDAPIAVIATEASIASGSFQKAIKACLPAGSDREIIALPTQNFVSLCETGHISPDDPELMQSVEEYLTPVKRAGATALLLGCTHFGIISQAISAFLGKETQIISASRCAAEAAAQYLKSRDLTGGEGVSRYVTSGSSSGFDAMAKIILGSGYASAAEHTDPFII